jgi:hypothetical protein
MYKKFWFGDPGLDRKIILHWIFREIGWIQQDQDRIQMWASVQREINILIQLKQEVHEQHSKGKLLQRDLVW